MSQHEAELEISRKIQLIGKHFNWDLDAFFAAVKRERLQACFKPPAAPTEAPAPEPQQYDPRTDPSTNWVLDYAIELERIQESRNHVLIDGRGNKSPVLTRGTIIDAIWKYLAAPQAESAGKPDAQQCADTIAAFVTSTHEGCDTIDILRCNIKRLGAEIIEAYSAKLRAELEQAKQYGRTEYGIEQILRADIEKLRADLTAAESSVTRLTRERDDWKFDCAARDKRIQTLQNKYEMVGVDVCTTMQRAETAERERDEAKEALEYGFRMVADRKGEGDFSVAKFLEMAEAALVPTNAEKEG